MKRFLRQINRILYIGICSIICMYILLYITLNIPYFQNSIKSLIISETERILDTPISADKIIINPYNSIDLYNFTFQDKQNDTIAHISRLSTSINIFKIFSSRKLIINSVQLSDFDIRINKASSDAPLNIQYIIEKLKSNPQQESTNIAINIKSIVIRNGKVSYDILDQDHEYENFDKNHIGINNISATLFINEITNDSISIKLKKLSFKEKSGYNHKNISFSLNSNYENFSIENFNLITNKSSIKSNNITISLDSVKNRESNHILDRLQIDFDLIGENIYLNEFTPFYNKLENFDLPLNFNLGIKGYGNDLHITKIRIYSENDIDLAGDAQINGINNGLDAYIFGQINKCKISQTSIKKLSNVFLDKKTTEILQRLGYVDFKGEISGFFNNLVAFGKLNTNIGSINTDILIGKNNIHKYYQGFIKCESFNLKEFTNNNLFGNIAFNININALQNNEKNSFRSNIDGVIKEFDFKDYSYRDIKCKGEIDNNEFDGSIILDDINGFLSIDADVKFDKEKSKMIFYAKAKDLHLDKLGISPKHENTTFSFNISSDLQGNKIDNFNGALVFDSIYIKNAKESFLINNLNFTAYNNETPQALRVSSDIMNAQIVGKYKFSTIYNSFTNLLSETLQFINTNQSKNIKGNNNEFEYSLKLNSCEKLWSLLLIPISFNEPISLSGYYSDIDKKNLSFTFDMPDFKFKKTRTKDIHIDLKVPENRFSLDVNGTIINKKNKPINIDLSSISKDKSINTRLNWSNSDKNIYKGTILTRTSIEKRKSDFPYKTRIELIPSNIIINDSIWDLKYSDILIDSSRVQINDLKFFNQSQSLDITGALSKNSNDTISIDLNNINLDYIFDMVNMNVIMFGGNGTGNFNIHSKDENLFIYTDSLKIKDFTYNNELMGDLNLASNIDINDLDIYLSGKINSENKISYVEGRILPKRDSLYLNFNAENLNCAFTKIWTDQILQNLQGKASADMSLYGKFKELNLVGKAWTNNISFGIDFLNTRYNISDTLNFTDKGISVDNILLYDSNNSFARVKGDISYNHFKDINYNIDITIPSSNNFLVFDTNEKINSLYWGTIFASGNANISGDTDKTKINVSGITKGNSRFYFSLNENMGAEDYQFIKFNDKNLIKRADSHHNHNDTIEDNKNNIFLNLQVDATPDATVNLIMDSSSGDVIKGNGSGNIRLVYNNVDEVKLFGKYNINKGSYTFNFQDFFTREFYLKEGSNIEFGGDPFNTKLDINTYYQVTANLAELDESFGDSKEISRTSVPVQCLLNINGDIRQPDLDFNINLPTVSQDTDRRIRSIIGTQEMMNKQIIYLMVLNKFYKPDYMSQNQQNRYSDLTSVASSTISSQLNSLLGQLSDNWNIGTNIRSEKGDFSDVEVQLALSSQLLNNRLLFNGNLGYKDSQTANNTNSFIGDFDLEYLLNPGGNLRLKAYNHYNDKNYSIKSALTTQGVGIMAKKEFNTISDLFNLFIRRKKKSEPEIDPLTANESN